MLAIEQGAGQHTLDAATIELWMYHHGEHMRCRAEAARHDAALKKMGSEYVAAVRREQTRWDAEHAEVAV